MRFSVSVLGREVLSIRTGEGTTESPTDHDNNCSQVELAGDVPVGFHSQHIPSLNRHTS